MTTTMTMSRTMDTMKARDFFENKMAFTTGPVELERMMTHRENITIIDVRASEDYRDGHIPGAINLPIEEWESLQGLSKDKVNVVYCYSIVCHLAAKAAVEFTGKGYPVMELDGGFASWKNHEMSIEK